MEKNLRPKAARWLRWPSRPHWGYMSCQVVTAGAVIWWLSSYRHLPWTGVAVAIIAVMAALMSVHPRIQPADKFLYLILIAGLLAVEFRAMYKDRKEAQDAQNNFQVQEDGRLGKLLDSERQNTKILLDQENASFTTVLSQDQIQFKSTMTALLDTHRQDEKDFAGVVKKEEGLIEAQEDLSERLAGRLVPGNRPTPATGCLRNGGDPPEGTVLVIFGDNGSLATRFPHTVMKIGDTEVISIDRVENSNALALSLNFRDQENRVAFRMDKNGVVDRIGSLIFLHPNKSTFLIQDSFGNEFLRATYVNSKVFEIQGKAIYCGKVFEVQNKQFHDSCASLGGGIDWSYTGPTCPMPPQ